MSEERAATGVDEHLGKRLKARRLVLDLSQERLAFLVGVTFQQIQKYENGVNRIAASRLWEMAKALGVSVQYFYEGLTVAPAGVAEEGAPDLVNDLVFDMMATPEGQQLLQIFGAIQSAKVRRKVVDIVRAVASTEDDQAP